MFKRFHNFSEAVRLTVLNLQKLLFALISALNRNTATNTALLDTAQAALAAAQATQAACEYLRNSERHRREQSGQLTEFVI
jgi:hypothetical protein